MYCIVCQCAVVSIHKYKKDAIKEMNKWLLDIPVKYREEARRGMEIKPITEVSSYEMSFFING